MAESKWGIHVRQRTKVIRVAEVLEKWVRADTGFESIRIRDQEGKVHRLEAVDFHDKDWKAIRTGAVIGLILRESIVGQGVLSLKGCPECAHRVYVSSIETCPHCGASLE